VQIVSESRPPDHFAAELHDQLRSVEVRLPEEVRELLAAQRALHTRVTPRDHPPAALDHAAARLTAEHRRT
jgi:hypothetical protein